MLQKIEKNLKLCYNPKKQRWRLTLCLNEKLMIDF